MTTENGRRDPLDAFVTRDELAEMFGVSVATVQHWRGIPRVQIGRKVFYRRADVADWLDQKIGRYIRD